MRYLSCLFSCAAILAITAAGTAFQETQPVSIVQQLRDEARSLAAIAKSELAKRFLGAVEHLPEPTARTLHRSSDRARYLTSAQFAKLPEAEKADFKPLELPPGFYYTTRYGSPLAYVRALDIVAEAGLRDLAGKRVLDFGYGGIGHLRMMASLGADVVGVELDPLLAAYYSEPGDGGAVKAGSTTGRLTLANGHWPGEAGVKAAVGGNFDLILSKNTLKNGYINPEREVDPRMLVKLGVEHEVFVQALFDALNPGGIVLIYNLCPAPAAPDKPYIPWADGRSPFPEAMYQKVGFRVLAYDRQDDAAARALGKALGWDQGRSAMDLEKDLFAWYTLLQRP